MEFLRFGVVGVNGMGFGHLKTASSSPAAKLTAICDIDLDVAKARRDELGLDVPIYEKFEDMLAEADIDAVALATPHYLHCPHAVAAAEAGKHVLTEKPLAISVAEGDRMIEAAKKNGVVLGVGHQRRWSGAMRGMRKVLNDGTLGSPYRFQYANASVRTEAYYASGPWRGRWDQEGGGNLINQHVHDLDAICYLLGKPVEVSAWTANWSHKHEVEDVAMAIVTFDSGWTGTINMSLSSAGGWGASANIFEGEKGVINGNKIAMRTHESRAFIADSPQVKPTLSEFTPVAPEPMDLEGRDRYYQDFLKAVNGELTFEGTGEECLPSIELVNAIFLSSMTGRRVTCPLDRDEVTAMFTDLASGKRTMKRIR